MQRADREDKKHIRKESLLKNRTSDIRNARMVTFQNSLIQSNHRLKFIGWTWSNTMERMPLNSHLLYPYTLRIADFTYILLFILITE